ncbi:hypothetical protein QNN00_21120 [Bacillus velezensis]|nr:hypothetical protein [Bacillus velezensis]
MLRQNLFLRPDEKTLYSTPPPETYEHSLEPENKTRQEERHMNEPVAIVGISGRFPKQIRWKTFGKELKKGGILLQTFLKIVGTGKSLTAIRSGTSIEQK